MSDEADYIDMNRDLWNARADEHLHSEFYDLAGFLAGRNSLNEPELRLLGDVNEKSILHLQCHFGQDTLSLARMGAEVTGVDFSENAIINAVDIASKMKLQADFICCDIYKLMNCLMKKYDIVFTSYGTVGWLPDIDRWATTVANYVKPGGKFVMADFHPYIWMYDTRLENIPHRYFNSGPIVETETGSYATSRKGEERKYAGWNHALSEIIGSLLRKGLTLNSFAELDYSPYNVFEGMVESEKGKFRIEKFGNRIPLMYTLLMERSA